MAEVRSLPEENCRLVAHQGHPASVLCVVFAVCTFGPVACLSDVAIPDCFTAPTGCAGRAGEASQNPPDASIGGGQSRAAGGSTAGTVDKDGGEAGDATADAGNAGGSGGHSGVPDGGLGGLPGEAGGTCGTCVIDPGVLPDPCASVASYSAALSISGGTPPYHWSVSASNGNWRVDPDPDYPDATHVLLSGGSTGPANVIAQAIDDLGLELQKTYSLTPRNACYFAYVEADTSGGKLNVLDPLLESAPSHTLAHNQGVYDFQFSPDGRFLAYRYGQDADHPKGAHLSLLDLSTWEERTLAFSEDAVTAFAWSTDAKVLAVSFVAGSDTFLGGVHFDTSAAADAALVPLTRVLSPTPVEPNLYWAGSGFVAFYAVVDPFPPGFPYDLVTAFYAPLGAAGFGAPIAIDAKQYTPPVVIQPTDAGFFLTSATDETSTFNGLAPDVLVVRDHGTDFVAPSGHFTASLAADTLQLFRAEDLRQSGPFVQSDAGTGCPKLLTWSANRERIACVADVANSSTGTTHGEIRIFDLLRHSAGAR